MINTSNQYCREIVNLLATHGVRTAFCSPGSRNVPLLVALNACTEIDKRVVVDERSSAFQALGFSMVKQMPVALVCTSGSAVLNYAPAIAEAYYAGVPLIVISADRPREWIDQDDSQTIRQFEVLDHIVKGSYDVRAIAEHDNVFPNKVAWHINRTVNEAMTCAMSGKKGPVHINVQLDSPLGELEIESKDYCRKVTLTKVSETVDAAVMRDLASMALHSRIMVVAGFGYPDNQMNTALRYLQNLPNVVMMAETIANLKGIPADSHMIDSVLCMMGEDEKEAMRPDIVISFGGALVSRMLKEYIRKYPPCAHWSVGHSNYFGDCFQSMTERIEISPQIFLKQLYHSVCKLRRRPGFKSGSNDDYSDSWRSLREYADNVNCDFVHQSPWSDLGVMDSILGFFSSENIFLSNGTPVRYAQLINHKFHAEYCNRGVSGIDGCTSTAIGGALAYSGQTVLITGDMSWIYDSGASTLGSVPPSMTIIVIDNGGGAIFRFIGSTSTLPEDFKERYLCTESHIDILRIAETYGFETRSMDSFQQMNATKNWLMRKTNHPKLLYIKTSGQISADLLKAYFSRNKQ